MSSAVKKAVTGSLVALVILSVPWLYLFQQYISSVRVSVVILAIQGIVYVAVGVRYHKVLVRGKGVYDPNQIPRERSFNQTLAGFSLSALVFALGFLEGGSQLVEQLVPYLALALGLFSAGVLLIEYATLLRGVSIICSWIRYVGFTAVFLGLLNLSLVSLPFSVSVVFVSLIVVLLALWIVDLMLWGKHLKSIRKLLENEEV